MVDCHAILQLCNRKLVDSRKLSKQGSALLKMEGCLFCKIISKELPASNVVYEDQELIVLLDINPVHPGHLLVIPKAHSDDMLTMDPVDLQAVTARAQLAGRALMQQGYDGVNLVVNMKPAAHQVIMHTHFHVIPRVSGDGLKTWPQKPYAEGELLTWRAKLAPLLQ